MKSSRRALKNPFLMTFRFEKGSGDIYMVQELLGHRNISTTQKYLGVNYVDAKAAVEAVALIIESDRITFVGFTQNNPRRNTLFRSCTSGVRSLKTSRPGRNTNTHRRNRQDWVSREQNSMTPDDLVLKPTTSVKSKI